MGQGTFKQRFLKETALFVGLLFLGFVIVPIAIYWIAPRVLGDFGGAGYGDFFGSISAKIRGGDLTAWFFVLSPWLVWQILRLTAFAWRISGRQQG
jgi:hypothetical protein